jgi:hypothetical protein
LALEALEKLTDTEQTYEALDLGDKAITAIKQARSAPPVQEPVAWRVRFHYGTDGMAKRIGDWKLYGYSPTSEEDKEIEPLYTTPPAQPAPVQEPSFSEGWERRKVIGFDALVEALDYAERKGFMPDYIADAWEGFNYLVDEKHTPPAAQPAVQEPEHLQQGVDALVSAAGTALEVLEKHRQMKGEAPMGMLGVRAMEKIKEAFGLLYPQDDYEPPAAQPAPEQYTALEQALTRLQKRYGELEAKAAAQPSVPDAITDNSEDPNYRAGWNDCRQAMLQILKARTL